MKPHYNNPTTEQLLSLYKQGLIYNLRQLPDNEHRIYVHPRIMLRHKDSKDFHAFPFYLHSSQSLYCSNTDLISAVEVALYEHPSNIYYEFGKRMYRFNEYFASALRTKQFFII
jgi:hypothetical protein